MISPPADDMLSRTNRALLFDWGNTLMRTFPQFPGPMSTWPRVEAIPYAVETLVHLHPFYMLCLATNAVDSDQGEIRLALARAGLDQYLDRIYCYRTIGQKKLSPQFFAYILADLNLKASQVVMIGDDYEADILGALKFGIRAVWLQAQPFNVPSHPLLKVIPNLNQLPFALAHQE